jgi:hypothetical protein
MTHGTFKSKLIAAVIAAGFIAPVEAAEAIKIGVVTPLSGTYAGIGQQVKWGLELAAKEINAAGGIMDRKVELIYEDEEANPAVATQKAEKLFQVSKVDFLTGTVNSGSTLAVGQVAERNNRLTTTTVSFSDAITGEKCSPNLFRVNAIDEPTEGLAPIIVDEIFALIEQLREEDIPILLVEQNVHRALDVSTRFYALERGLIIYHGRASSEGNREELLKAIAV